MASNQMTSGPARWLRRSALLALLLGLAACGGGGEVDRGIGLWPLPNPNPYPPTNSCSSTGLAAAAQSSWPSVCMLTSSGEMVIELYDLGYAPNTVANFLRLVADGYYRNTLFHHVDRDFVVQGGGYTSGHREKPAPYAPIALESNNGLSNLRGTLAMARRSAPNTATTQFFINTVNNPGLDYKSASEPGYAVFGRVISGMNTLDAINVAPIYYYSASDIRPRQEILIYWVQRLK